MLEPARHINAITWSPRFQTPPSLHIPLLTTHTQISGSENAPQSRCRVSWRARYEKVWATSRRHRLTCVRSPIRTILQQAIKLNKSIQNYMQPLYSTHASLFFDTTPKHSDASVPTTHEFKKIPSKQRSCFWIHEYSRRAISTSSLMCSRWARQTSNSDSVFQNPFLHSYSVQIRHMIHRALTPRSRVLEKLTGFHLVKKFPAFYGT
jgi:hypothetical protein